MVNFAYQGEFKGFNSNSYEVILDETNNYVNVYYKSMRCGDVECYQFKKDYVETFSGSSILDKTKACWLYLADDPFKFAKNASLQVFPLSFWDDIVLKIKKDGKLDDSWCVGFYKG